MSRSGVYFLCFSSLLCFKFVSSCLYLNDEGRILLKIKERITRDPFDALRSWSCTSEKTYDDHCLWLGIECSAEGVIVAIDLSDLWLEGTLAPEIGNIPKLKSLILRNNSFTGNIPRALKNLKILDLHFNSFGVPSFDTVFKRQLKQNYPAPAPAPALSPSPSPAPARRKHKNSPRYHAPSPSPAREKSKASPRPHAPFPTKARDKPNSKFRSHAPSPAQEKSHGFASSPSFSFASSPTLSPAAPSKGLSKLTIVVITVVSVVCFLLMIITACFCVVSKSTVIPWAVLSGPLHVPKFSRAELEAGCEDFSNVIGTSPFGTAYKGTLTNGLEIAVTSPTAVSLKNWSQSAESQFRSKIETLSMVNHKNFVNLVGFCDETAPFTRMMVFEYVSNGSLFDHLHMPESEHLNWDTRVRIMMGMAYCLEYMHGLEPPVAVTYLASSTVFLTEDNAAKVSELSFASDTSENLKANVYGLGVIMFEMITGRVPSDTDKDWAFDFVGDDRSLMEMLDPTLEVADAEKVRKIWELMRLCVRSQAELRPSMKHVAASLKVITGISSDAALPRGTRMWWAEMAIMSPQIV